MHKLKKMALMAVGQSLAPDELAGGWGSQVGGGGRLGFGVAGGEPAAGDSGTLKNRDREGLQCWGSSFRGQAKARVVGGRAEECPRALPLLGGLNADRGATSCGAPAPQACSRCSRALTPTRAEPSQPRSSRLRSRTGATSCLRRVPGFECLSNPGIRHAQRRLRGLLPSAALGGGRLAGNCLAAGRRSTNT
jgi:hypothetical protein